MLDVVCGYEGTFNFVDNSGGGGGDGVHSVVLEVENGSDPMGCVFVFDSKEYRDTVTADALHWNGSHLECELPAVERDDVATNATPSAFPIDC